MYDRVGLPSVARMTPVSGAVTVFAAGLVFVSWNSPDRLRELIAQSTEGLAIVESSERRGRTGTWLSLAWRDTHGEVHRRSAYWPAGEPLITQSGRNFVRIRYFEHGVRPPMIMSDPKMSIARQETERTYALDARYSS